MSKVFHFMKYSQQWIACSLAFALSLCLVLAGPVEEITAYSAFKQIDINSLANGTILTQRGSFAGFSRGLALQSCYIVHKPVASTAEYLIWWDPTPHPELEVYTSINFRAGEDPKFDQLKIEGKQKAVTRLLDDIAKVKSGKAELQLSQDELNDLRQRLAALPTRNTDSPEFRKMSADFFSNLLKQRYALFLSGGMATLPEYSFQGGNLSVKSEINSLVKEDSKVAAHFADLINDILPQDPKSTPVAPHSYYWQLFKADSEAALCFGALYNRETPEKTQVMDCQLYVSNAYFTSVTIYELHPITINGSEQTLVWRADYVSAPMFAWLKGIDQMAATMLMMQSIKQSVHLFQVDAAAAK